MCLKWLGQPPTNHSIKRPVTSLKVETVEDRLLGDPSAPPMGVSAKKTSKQKRNWSKKGWLKCHFMSFLKYVYSILYIYMIIAKASNTASTLVIGQIGWQDVWRISIESFAGEWSVSSSWHYHHGERLFGSRQHRVCGLAMRRCP